MPHIDPRDRLIFALDVPSMGDAEHLIESLGDAVSFYKVGLELFTAGDGPGLVRRLKKAGTDPSCVSSAARVSMSGRIFNCWPPYFREIGRASCRERVLRLV